MITCPGSVIVDVIMLRQIMPPRLPLRNQLVSAWQNTIENHYANCLINSERSLQASFWSNLMSEFADSPRRTFIEPIIKIDSKTISKNRYPDLIVCNSKSVIAVVELKYSPRVGPKYKKDIDTLEWIAQNKSKLLVRNDRFLGDSSKLQPYRFANRVLYVWASVNRMQESNFNANSLVSGSKHLSKSFMLIQSGTFADEQPKTRYSFA
jgi:hypothetical protein